jgi:HAD superfamily hydrolase (TIGR01509 family)
MSAVRYLFLDNGGVIMDNSLLVPEYGRLVGELLVPRLGGTVAAWGKANIESFRGVRQRSVARLEAWDETTGDILREYYLYNLDWLRSMCDLMGIEAPADDTSAQIGMDVNQRILGQATQPFPGAVDAIRQLARDVTIFTASEGLSFQLDVILTNFGIRELFVRLYGTDVVNTAKQAANYYERVFADAGVEPADALVVDDLPEMLLKAARTGARTVLISSSSHGQSPFDAVIEGLRDLPGVLSDLARSSR